MEIYTFAISILALSLSIFQWIRVLWKERFAVNVTCVGYQLITSTVNESYRNYIFGFVVDNLSSTPTSLSYISFLSTQNKWVRFCLTKRFMKEHLIPPGANDSYRFFTTDFPVNIDSHSSVLVFAIFESMDGIEVSFDNEKANFKFKTSRKEKTLLIPCVKTSLLNQ